MGATGDRVNLAGTERPARCDAGLAGPAGPGQRLTVTVQARLPHPDPPTMVTRCTMSGWSPTW